MKKSGSQPVFQFMPKVLDRIEVRFRCRPVRFFHTKLRKPFLYGLVFETLSFGTMTYKLLAQSWRHTELKEDFHLLELKLEKDHSYTYSLPGCFVMDFNLLSLIDILSIHKQICG